MNRNRKRIVAAITFAAGIEASACGGTPFFDRNGLGVIENDATPEAPTVDAPDAFRALIEGDSGVVVGEAAAVVVEAGASVEAAVDSVAPDEAAPAEATAPEDACSTVYIHSNGIGASWADCVPLNTFNITQALAACRATYGSDCSYDGYICGKNSASPVCACWQIGGANAGWVFPGTWGSGGCAATVAAKMWN
jgi:hypothetical protein